ncbi:MAG: peptidylprolyl isomerase [Clostridiales bacterium]|nr:peptidylprolyl isomerase [Clostridiales bacterium]
MKTINTTVKFTDGKQIRLALYPEVAPITVENFVKLAKENFYNGLCFHRVIKDFMIQGGGFEYRDGLVHKTSQSIKGEFMANGIDNRLHHAPGVISMARTNIPDSASSQFFICVADCGFLDGQYAAFGMVRDQESLDAAIAISKVKTTRWTYYDDVPVEPIVIESVLIEE